MINIDLKQHIKKPEFSTLIILIAMFLLNVFLQKNFFEPKCVTRNINAFIPLILMTMGQGIVIISGAIDLSVGSALSLLTCVLATVMKNGDPITGLYAILIAFVVAILIGVINGIGIGYLRIPSIIITYATSYIWLGIALLLRPTPGGEAVEWFKMFYNVSYYKGASPLAIKIGSILPPALILLLIGCILWYLISKTLTGRYIYAVGSNDESAYASGINPAKIQMKACIINSMFIFLTALFFVGQNQSGDARMGDPMTLKVVASAVVGGIALTGGRGNVYFAIIGALILSFASKIIYFAHIPNAYQTLVNGLIVIVALLGSMVYTLYNKKAMLKGNE